MVHRSKSSHICSDLSIADNLAMLYAGEEMLFEPTIPQSRMLDRFILSKGHSCVFVTLP
jgi:transketolase N-terminal domain/subunit